MQRPEMLSLPEEKQAVGFGRRLPWAYLKPWLPTAIALAIMIIGWQIASAFYPAYLLPSPRSTLADLRDLFISHDLLLVFAQSMVALLIGLGTAIPVGIVLGLLTGAYPTLERAIGPFNDALYVTPKIMLIPLFIIWFGIGIEARVAYIFVSAYFPIVVNTFAGVRSMRAEYTETARAFLATPPDMFAHIYLPGSVPFIAAGVRLGVGRAILGMVTAEMFLAVVGLGYLVVYFGNRLATGKVLAMAIVISVFGILATELVKWFESRVAPWAEAQRRE